MKEEPLINISDDQVTDEDYPDEVFKEDLIEILSYIASICLFLLILFGAIYTFIPSLVQDFKGIRFNFPMSGLVNAILHFAVSSINSLFTYFFLAITGILCFAGAQYIEDGLESKERKTIHKYEPVSPGKVEILKTELIEIDKKSGSIHSQPLIKPSFEEIQEKTDEKIPKSIFPVEIKLVPASPEGTGNKIIKRNSRVSVKPSPDLGKSLDEITRIKNNKLNIKEVKRQQ